MLCHKYLVLKWFQSGYSHFNQFLITIYFYFILLIHHPYLNVLWYYLCEYRIRLIKVKFSFKINYCGYNRNNYVFIKNIWNLLSKFTCHTANIQLHVIIARDEQYVPNKFINKYFRYYSMIAQKLTPVSFTNFSKKKKNSLHFSLTLPKEL